MIKYLFSDIDGTLYVNDDVSPLDVAATHEFVRRGGIFSMATGRADLEISQFAQQEGFPVPRFRISANGSMHVDDEQTKYQQFSQAAKLFLQKHLTPVLDDLVVVEVSSPDHIYFLMEPEEWVINYKDNAYTIGSEIIKDFGEEHFEILKMYLEGDPDFIADLLVKMEEELPGEFDIFNDVTAVNLVPNGKSKGAAILEIMEKYDIKPEEIATIGDAANDISMLEITPNSFTFDYSADFVKEKAQYVVRNVAEAIQIILLQNRDEERKEI